MFGSLVGKIRHSGDTLGIKSGMDYGAKVIYDAEVRGHVDGMKLAQGSSIAGFSGTSMAGFGDTGGWGLPGFGVGGFMNSPMPGGTVRTSSGTMSLIGKGGK